MSAARTPEQIFINGLRAALRKRPLYDFETKMEPCGTYLSKEALRQAASPDCDRCGGSGYYDGWELEMRCPCTGMPPKGSRGTGKHTHVLRTFAMSRKPTTGA